MLIVSTESYMQYERVQHSDLSQNVAETLMSRHGKRWQEGEPMEVVDVAQRHFEAWNRHDPDSIVATFAEGGPYSDPNVPWGLRGKPSRSTQAGCSRPSRTSHSRCLATPSPVMGW